MLFEKIDEFFKSHLQGSELESYLKNGCIACFVLGRVHMESINGHKKVDRHWAPKWFSLHHQVNGMPHSCSCKKCQTPIAQAFLKLLEECGSSIEELNRMCNHYGEPDHFPLSGFVVTTDEDGDQCLRGMNGHGFACYGREKLQERIAFYLEGVSGKAW